MTSLSTTTAERSGRFLISGSGFGAGTGTVTVGGVNAPVSRWSDTQVNAYVPEGAAIGSDDVVVVTAGGSGSNAAQLSVQTRQQNGRAKWRIAVEGNYLLQRPAVAPDGTVAAVDSYGDLYEVTANGGLKWIRTGAGSDGVPSFGADGTVYTAGGGSIRAYAPDGTLKWTFTEPPGGQGVMAGPTVGPDGNIYAMTDLGGLGAIALSPVGQLLWSNLGNPQLSEYGQIGAEVVFGPSKAGGASNQLYGAFDDQPFTYAELWAFSLGGSQNWSRSAAGSDDPLTQQQRQPRVGPDGTVYLTGLGGPNGTSLYAFDPGAGALKWLYSPYPSNGMSPPSVGSDGTIYLARSLSYLDAVTPTGSTKWTAPFDGSIIDKPEVSPVNDLVVAGDRPNYGEPGSVRGYATVDGSPQWQLDLPSENGSYQIAYSAFRFSADGQTAYVGTSLPGNPNAPDQYSYLYAIDTSGSAPPPAGVSLSSLTLSPAQVNGGSPSTGTAVLSGPAPTAGATVQLSSSNTSVATTPVSVKVPAGATSATFTVSTSSVTATSAAVISGSYGGQSQSSTLTVVPPPPPAAALSSVTLSPTRVRGGSISTGTVQLTAAAPAGGALVTLRSSNTRVASVPVSVTVPAGRSTAAFTVRTSRVVNTTTVTISAAYAGRSKTATLTVTR